MSLRAKALHYSSFKDPKSFLMKAKWKNCIVVDVNDVRKHCHDIFWLQRLIYFVFLNMAATQSYSDRSLKLKCEVLQDLEKGASQKDLAQKYAIPPNTISTWKKNKKKIFESYEKGSNSERIKPEVFETINKALMKWLLNLRRENIPINGLLLKEKTSDFAKELGVPNFQASDR